ncbi:hypothetical protein [Sunxiuqinia indica]|uniref:hypothetical protein n=1 Tax=Sunxiuqinia indica TaxID=2692584 RepID=UPI00135B59A9|nr:hypothetical protein [Sunxiuqinia indica]
MKLIILASSVFYLLGLKLTHEVKINQPLIPDSVSITAPAEITPTPEIKHSDEQLPTIKQDKEDSISSYGSTEITAPWGPMKNNLNIPAEA